MQMPRISPHRRRLIGGATMVTLSSFTGCAEHTPQEPDNAPDEPGTLVMSLQRAMNSQVPASAESAFVRVWHPTTQFNQVVTAPIPAPGTTTQVTFNVPAGSGYSVGVIAWRRDATVQLEALAGGRRDSVTVAAGTNGPVAVTVAPWTYTISGPVTVQSGTVVRFRATVKGPLKDFFSNAWILAGTKSWTDYRTRPGQNQGAAVDGDSIVGSFTVPTYSGDSAVYVGFDLYGDYAQWQSQRPIYLLLPSITLGGEPTRVPATVPGGSLVVSFTPGTRPRR